MSSSFIAERAPDWTVQLDDFVRSVSWSPDGSFIVASKASGPLLAFRSQDSRELQAWAGHEGGTFAGLCSPVAPLIASVGQDGHLRLWTLESPAARHTVPAGALWVEQLAWAPDGSCIAIGAGKKVTLLNPDGTVRHSLTPLRSTVSAFAWSHDSRLLAAANYGGVHRWDSHSGDALDVLPWKTSLLSLAWSSDQRWIVAGTQEQSVQIWELPYRSGEELAMSGYPGKVRELAWHHGGRYLATGGGPDVTVWDCGGRGPAGTTPRILTGHEERVSSLSYQYSGHLLASGGADGRVLLWNAGKSSLALRQYRFASPIIQTAWSRDDQRLAIACQDGTVAVATVGRF